MDKKYKRRLIALLLSLALIITYMPTSFLAYAVDDNPAVTQEDTTGTGTDVGDGTGTDAGDGTGTDLGDGTGTDLGDGTGADQQPADTPEETGETDTPVVDEPLATESSGNRDAADGEDIGVSDDGNITLIVSINKKDLRNVDGHWVRDVQNENSGEEFQYNIRLDINESVYREYEKGAIKITIPAGILKHMNYTTSNQGVYDPAANRSLEETVNSCSLKGSVKPYDDATTDDDWYYTREKINGRYYDIIVNNKKMSSIDADSIEFQVIYKTLYSSYQYADFTPSDLEHCASDPFDVHLEATYPNGSKTQADAHGPEVYLNTSAVIGTLNKDLNTTWEALETDENGNETNYLYLQYKVEVRVDGTTPSSKPTQQYDLIFDDAFTGAFSNMMADWTMSGDLDGVSDAQYELIGYSSSSGQDASLYTKNEDGTYVVKGTWNPQQYVTRYVLVRVEKPIDALKLNYTLDNKIKVTVDPLGGGDPSTYKYDTEKFSKAYNNTRPTGRFMIHKWSNSNYDSADHSRTDAYGVHTNYKKDWGHQNNELDFFKSGSVDYLRELRYFTWYEGYSVRYTPYTKPHELSYEFTDQDLSIEYYTSRKPFTTGKLSDRNCALNANDYFFSEIDFYPEAQNATYDEEKSKWIITRSGDPFEGDTPIIIEAKFGSYSSGWTEVATATYSKNYSDSNANATGSITASDSRVDVSFGTYEGEKYRTEDTGFIIKFNTPDCVAYRIRHTNDHYYFMCNVKTTVNLKPTTHVKNNLTANYVYIANFADMSVYDQTSENDDKRIFNFNDNAGEHLVNRVAGAAAVRQNNLLRTNKYLADDEKDDDNRLYRTTWQLAGTGYAYAGVTAVGQEYPVTYEKLKKGTFYDMLPRGSELYPDTQNIKVYNVLINQNYYSHIQLGNANYDPAIDQNYLLSPDQYTVELIEGTYNPGESNAHSLNGLTMLKVTINAPVADTIVAEGCVPGYTVVYDTVSYYEDLNRYGNTLLNATAFEAGNGTTYHEMGFPDDPRGHDLHKNDNNNNQGNTTFLMNIPTDHPDREAVLDALTNLESKNDNYWFGYDFAVTTAYYNEYNLSGLSKRVRLAGETSWGIKREVEPGGQYQYRIKYSTNSGTSVKDVILSDKIERYVNEEGVSSEWYGTLKSMSFELPRGSTENPANFKYYVSSDPNVAVDENIDLASSSWTQVEYGADLSDMNVKCVAVDTQGYTLPPSSSMGLILNMKAPDENDTNKAWPTTYNDSHCKGYQVQGSGGGQDGLAFFNVSNQTQVIYTLGGKVKVKKVDEEGKPIANVTFTLKGTSSLLDQNGDHAEIDMTALTDHNGYAVFENVPLSGTGYYTLEEVVPDGYEDEFRSWKVEILEDGSTQIDGKAMDEAGFTIVNKEGTVVLVTKKWVRANGYAHGPSGAKVTLQLYRDGVAYGDPVILDGTKDTKQQGKVGYEYQSWKAKFTGLPKYKNKLLSIEYKYTVKELEPLTPGFEVTYDTGEDYTTDGGVITNTEKTIDVSADKAWLGLDGETDPPEGATATFILLTRRSEHSYYSTSFQVTLDGTVDPEPKGQGAYESEPWKATFKKMPKYGTVNGQYVELQYVIRESEAWWDDYHSDTSYVENGGVLTNKREPATITANKRWKYISMSSNTTNAPEGATVTLTLYADGEDTGINCILDGTTDEAPTGPGGYERTAWQACFVNIPKYKMVNGTRELINYTVAETAGWPGFSEPTEAVVSGKILVNTEKPIEVTAEKDWADNEGNKLDPPAGAKVTFTLYADGVAQTNKKVVLDGTADSESNNGYEYEAWKAKFPNLPKYKIVNNKVVEIKYTVKETVTWPGYTPTPEDGVESGGTITNTLPLTEVTVEKAWDPLDLSGGAPTNAKVTFTLYADNVEQSTKKVVLDGTPDTAASDNGYESAAWKATFPNLPKYKAVNGQAVEIKYTVKETGTWPGYRVVYEGGESATFAVDGGTITNREEMVSLSVKKAWVNYGGSTTPPDNAEVTFTLYADGEQTPYSVTLEGIDNADSIMQGGQETPAWTASFVRLPKYRVNDKDELVEIVYTVKETGPWPGYTVSYEGGETITYAVNGETITNTQINAKGSTTFEGTKNIEGRSFREYDEWTFTVTPLNGAPMNDKDGNAIGSAASPYQYVLNKDTGITVGQTTATFVTPAIYFTMDDVGKTYKYKITESGNITGVTNDTTVYTVTVTIENNNDGTLKVTKKYTRPKKLIPVTPFNPNIPGGRILDGYEVGWLNNLELEEQELKPFNPGTGEINPGNGGTIQPIDPGTGGGIVNKLEEETTNAEFTNVYTPPELEITKKLDGFVDTGDYSNVTLAFKVEGYRNGSSDPAYTNYVGMTLTKNDAYEVDADGYYTKTVKLTGMPDLDRIVISEVYSDNYDPEQENPVVAEYIANRHIWVATFKNKHHGGPPSSGVVNKYDDSGVTQQGLIEGEGDTSAGRKQGN